MAGPCPSPAQTMHSGIQEIVDGGILHVPAPFVQPAHLRPRLSDVVSDQGEQIPIINLSGLLSGGHRRLQTIHDIGRACEDWGFFQVINHGVPQAVMDEMKASCQRFFGQPAKERNRYRRENLDDPIGYTTSKFTQISAKARDWKDVLFIRESPGKCNGFEEAPSYCKRAFQDYRDAICKLANLIYQAIFQSLGFGSDYLTMALPAISRLTMGINYYPECPDPCLTLGSSEHTDAGCLTVLLPGEVPGLQIRKADIWIALKPHPNAFVINLGDQIEILTNGAYRSIEHRVVTNVDKPRFSVACLFTPTEDTRVAPLSKLVTENRPARYKDVVYGEYLKNYFSRDLLSDRAALNFAKTTMD